MLKFDPATQNSEVSLLKDIVTQDTLQRFHKHNFPEMKQIGFNYKELSDGIFKTSGLQISTEFKHTKAKPSKQLDFYHQSMGRTADLSQGNIMMRPPKNEMYVDEFHQ